MIRTKGEVERKYCRSCASYAYAKPGNPILTKMDHAELMAEAERGWGRLFHLVEQVAQSGELPVPNLQQAVLPPLQMQPMMQLGAQTLFCRLWHF